MREVRTAKGTTFSVNFPDITGWAQIQHRLDLRLGHRYTVVDVASGDEVGFLRYILDFPTPGIVTVAGVRIDPAYRERNVGVALIARLHADHPDHKVDPNFPTEEGMDFMCSIMLTEPEVLAAIHMNPELEAAVRRHPLTNHLYP
jgi:GNAT superfamily N-acetyltransferase